MDEPKGLSDLFPAWPADGPADLAELLFFDDESLNAYPDPAAREMMRQLRTQVRKAALSWGRSVQLNSPEAVERCLSNGDLRLLTKRWVTLALDRSRRRTFNPYGADSSRTVEKLSKWVPDADKLPKLPTDGAYLVLYGGSPDVLAIDDVRERLRRLQSEAPVADVLFRHREPGRSTLFSLRQGFGVRNNEQIEFPNPAFVTETALWTRPGGASPQEEGGAA